METMEHVVLDESMIFPENLDNRLVTHDGVKCNFCEFTCPNVTWKTKDDLWWIQHECRCVNRTSAHGQMDGNKERRPLQVDADMWMGKEES